MRVPTRIPEISFCGGGGPTIPRHSNCGCFGDACCCCCCCFCCWFCFVFPLGVFCCAPPAVLVVMGRSAHKMIAPFVVPITIIRLLKLLLLLLLIALGLLHTRRHVTFPYCNGTLFFNMALLTLLTPSTQISNSLLLLLSLRLPLRLCFFCFWFLLSFPSPLSSLLLSLVLEPAGIFCCGEGVLLLLLLLSSFSTSRCSCVIGGASGGCLETSCCC